ncbi:MAG: sigma-70 family RNA polymerase sigma factor [Lachnospiraceae bacterium]|nr:sigma-70 family RNA polymerase sigma factor [Lachnospiraceae bacterium]
MEHNTLEDAVDAWGDLIYRFALTRLQNREDAEDVFQNTFLKLLEYTEWEHWEKDHVRAWLVRIAMSECADVGRRRGRQSFLTEEDLDRLTEEPVPADQAEVWDQVADLDEPDRSIVYLYYGEGYSLKEIAQMLGLTHGNCRVILHRVRKKLKEKLAGKQTAERRRHGRVREISEYDEKHSCAGRT